MAYMARQFLKGNNMRLPGNSPVKVNIMNNRNEIYINQHLNRDITEFIMTFKRVDVEYECHSCGYKHTLIGRDDVVWCSNCYERKSIEKTLREGARYQVFEFNQAEAESLLEGLLVKVTKNINPETKIKLISLLSAS